MCSERQAGARLRVRGQADHDEDWCMVVGAPGGHCAGKNCDKPVFLQTADRKQSVVEVGDQIRSYNKAQERERGYLNWVSQGHSEMSGFWTDLEGN